MSWQDMVLTCGQTIFLVILARVALDKGTKIDRLCSSANALILGEFAHVFWTLGLYGSAITEMGCALLWTWIAWKRNTEKQETP